MRVYLIAYDIASPKRWRRVAARLKKVGNRTQYSVFLLPLMPRQAKKLEKQLNAMLDLKEDRLMMIDLGTHSDAETRISGVDFNPPKALIV